MKTFCILVEVKCSENCVYVLIYEHCFVIRVLTNAERQTKSPLNC